MNRLHRHAQLEMLKEIYIGAQGRQDLNKKNQQVLKAVTRELKIRGELPVPVQVNSTIH